MRRKKEKLMRKGKERKERGEEGRVRGRKRQTLYATNLCNVYRVYHV